MSWIDTMIKRVRDYDASRPRSVQTEPGWSEVGGCRAYLGFRLDGAFASDDPDIWGAIRGTALHKFLETVLADEPGVRIEVDTLYRGIPGHADLVVIDEDSVTDHKTTKLANSKLWQQDTAALWEKRVQVHGYAAGLIEAGELPETAMVRLLVIPVDGTFADWWCWQEPFSREIADWGADRLEAVRRKLDAGEPLAKDKPYAYCKDWCKFFSLCREASQPAGEQITDPELAAAVARYGEINSIVIPLGKEKKGLAPVIRGLRGIAGDWRVSTGEPGEDREALDEDAIYARYAALGEQVPMAVKPGNAPRLTVTKIKAPK
jgi:hypothetical protein